MERSRLSGSEPKVMRSALIAQLPRLSQAVRIAQIQLLKDSQSSKWGRAMLLPIKKRPIHFDFRQRLRRLRVAQATRKVRQNQRHLEAKKTETEEHLREKRDALEQRSKEIDDREARHARRAIRGDLKEILRGRAKEFVLSKGTQEKRRPIRLTLWALMGILGAGLVVTFLGGIHIIEIGDIRSADLIVSRIALGVAFAAASLFYVRWENHWFSQHALEEFALKKMEIDFDRASWAVELAFEWKKDNGTEIPLPIFEVLSKNLFGAPEKLSPPQHPVEQLAAVLGSSTKVRIAYPGGEAEFDRNGIKRLSKDS